MRLDIGHQGDWIVDPRELSLRLGVTTLALKRMKRHGEVSARVVLGTDGDAGRSLVTVRLPDRGWRGTFDQSGALISEEMW